MSVNMASEYLPIAEKARLCTDTITREKKPRVYITLHLAMLLFSMSCLLLTITFYKHRQHHFPCKTFGIRSMTGMNAVNIAFHGTAVENFRTQFPVF
jgi:hypothetical protein